MAMRRRSAWLALIVPLVIIGCAETQPTKFYILSAETASAGGTVLRGPKTPVVGVANATLPGYLDRPQIVSCTSANAMEIDEFHRWAEPLDSLFTRILAQNLSGNLGQDAIVELASNRVGSIDYLVEVDVLRFDAQAKERAVLDARWRFVDPARERVISRGQVIANEPIDAPADYEAVVAAMSRLAAVLSRDLAAAIKVKAR